MKNIFLSALFIYSLIFSQISVADGQERAMPYVSPRNIEQLFVNINEYFMRGYIYQAKYFSDDLMEKNFSMKLDSVMASLMEKKYVFFDMATRKNMTVYFSPPSYASNDFPYVFLKMAIAESGELVTFDALQKRMIFFNQPCNSGALFIAQGGLGSSDSKAKFTACKIQTNKLTNEFSVKEKPDSGIYEVEIGFH